SGNRERAGEGEIVRRHGRVHGGAGRRRGGVRRVGAVRARQRADVRRTARCGGRGISRGGFRVRRAAGDDVSLDSAAAGRAERAVRGAAAQRRGRGGAARLLLRCGRRRVLPRVVHHLAGAHRGSGAARGSRARDARGGGRMKRRPSGALVLSICLHVVLIVGLVWIMAVPLPFQKWMDQHREAPAEHLGYLQVPNEGVTRPGRNGGNNIPRTHTRPRPFVAPATAPSAIPKASTQPTPSAGNGTGPQVGLGGAESGITPSFSDPRLWLPPGPVLGVPRSQSQ